MWHVNRHRTLEHWNTERHKCDVTITSLKVIHPRVNEDFHVGLGVHDMGWKSLERPVMAADPLISFFSSLFSAQHCLTLCWLLFFCAITVLYFFRTFEAVVPTVITWAGLQRDRTPGHWSPLMPTVTSQMCMLLLVLRTASVDIFFLQKKKNKRQLEPSFFFLLLL